MKTVENRGISEHETLTEDFKLKIELK